MKILFICHGTTQFVACIQAQNCGIMRHVLPGKHFLTTKKLRFTKDKTISLKNTHCVNRGHVLQYTQ